MANYWQSMQNNTVTARKFVEIGANGDDVKGKIKLLSQAYLSQMSSAQLTELGKITSDKTVTPDEKKLLKEEWEHIQSAYSSVVAAAADMDIDDTEEFEAYKNAYEKLAEIMESILADMSTTTQLSSSVDSIINEYNSAANLFNIYMTTVSNALLRDINDIRLAVITDKDYFDPGENIVFNGIVQVMNLNTGMFEELTEAQKSIYLDSDTGLYPKLYQWQFSGTKDDDYWNTFAQGKRDVTIPSSAFFRDRIEVILNSDLIVGK